MDIYDELFNGDDPDTEFDIRESEEDRVARLKEEELTKQDKRRMGWHSLVYYIADGDVLKFAKVLELNAHLVLTHKLFENGNKKLRDYVKGR